MTKMQGLVQRLAFISISFMLLLAACRPVKKVQRIGEVITTKDTSTTITLNKPAVTATDSAVVIRNILKSLDTQRIDFKTFSAKVKMDYDGSEGNGQATVYLRMQKDSLIWLSLTGALGIEGYRVIITKDSVKLMNKLAKVVQYRSISYLQNLTHVPINFYSMQDILIGNPLYLDSNIVSYQYNNNNLLILMAGTVFKNLLTLGKDDLRILHSKLDDVEPARNRTADITYSDYTKVKNFNFSTVRKISIAEKTKLDIDLEFKQYNFDDPQSFPFSINGYYYLYPLNQV